MSSLRIDNPNSGTRLIHVDRDAHCVMWASGADGSVGLRVDPQALVDALAELFPDVEPSPPRPKVGDRVAGRGHAGIVVDIVGDRANVRIEGIDGKRVWWSTFPMANLTVVERGAS